mgnify:CR=1 FL=1
MEEITNAAPQIVNLMEKGGITPDQAEKVAQDLVGEYGWFILAGLVAILTNSHKSPSWLNVSWKSFLISLKASLLIEGHQVILFFFYKNVLSVWF